MHFEDSTNGKVIQLDELDKAIIEIQQKDVFFSYAKLAKKYSVTEATIRNRIKRLRANGVMDLILVINPSKIGYAIISLIGVRVKSGCSPDTVISALKDASGVNSIMHVTGRYDLFVEYVCRNLAEYREFTKLVMREVPGIERFESFIGMKTYKKRCELVVE